MIIVLLALFWGTFAISSAYRTVTILPSSLTTNQGRTYLLFLKNNDISTSVLIEHSDMLSGLLLADVSFFFLFIGSFLAFLQSSLAIGSRLHNYY